MEEEYIKLEEFEKGEEPGWKEKLGGFLESRYFTVAAFVLISIIAFSLGRISGLEEKRQPVRVISGGEVKGASVEQEKGLNSDPLNKPQDSASGEVVASKSGAKYHYPWCAGAKQISDKNRITFPSIEAARAAGYTPASNCKGLK